LIKWTKLEAKHRSKSIKSVKKCEENIHRLTEDALKFIWINLDWTLFEIDWKRKKWTQNWGKMQWNEFETVHKQSITWIKTDKSNSNLTQESRRHLLTRN